MTLLLLLLLPTQAALTPCTLAHPAGPRAYASCGSVDVAVDADKPAGAKVSIGFAVLPATGLEPKGAPIVLLAGGPGQAATRDYVALLPFLAPMREQHPLVLVDIRGTGRSQPQGCKDTRAIEEKVVDDGMGQLAACIAGLTLEPRFITTRDAARDVDAVRQALGHASWNVLGVSYGTRLAVVYDQQFPGKARTLILDGVAPLDRALAEDVPADMTNALRAAGEQALKDFVALKQKQKASPSAVTVLHPTTGKKITLPVDDRLINGTVRMLLYSDETRALLGPVLARALQGDLEGLVGLAITVGETLEGAIHSPVNGSILCAEDVPYFTTNPPPADAVFDDERPNMKKLCDSWPYKKNEPQPTMKQTKTPALLLSGQHDPITPPHHAKRIEAQFLDHAHVIVPGVGHNVLPKGCVADVVAEFVVAGTAKDLDSVCVSEIAAFPAFLDVMGPAP